MKVVELDSLQITASWPPAEVATTALARPDMQRIGTAQQAHCKAARLGDLEGGGGEIDSDDVVDAAKLGG